MTETLSPTDVLRVRVHALGLTATSWTRGELEAPGAERIAGVARRMLAVQGQDWRSARWALGVRAPGSAIADVEAAFAERRIVRSWPMRGTVHVVAAEDIGWMQGATNHRVLAGAPKRRAFLGMSDAVLERLVEVSLVALDAAGTAGLERDALAEAWTEAGIDWQSNWRYHVIWWICQNGMATFGPIGPSGEPLLVRAEHWITAPRQYSGDDALRELAVRYARCRGPFRVNDFAWWTGLTVAEARVGLAAARDAGELAEARARDTSGDPVSGAAGRLWVDPESLGSAVSEARLPEWTLLAAFDEHLLGYTDRTAQLDQQHFDRIVPGRNGMFLPTVLRKGRVVATWKRLRTKTGGLEIASFPDRDIDAPALAPLSRDWADFHGVETGGISVVQPADAG